MDLWSGCSWPTKGECAYGGRSGVLLLLFSSYVGGESHYHLSRDISHLKIWSSFSLSLPAVFSWGGCCYDCGLLNFSAHLFPFPPSISLFPSFCTFFFFFFFPQNFTPLSYCSSNTILIFIFYSSYHLFSTHLLWKPPLSLFIFKYYPFFLIVGILISLHASQLISQGPKVNDHLSLQWL
jgi:hypothetical protein